VGFGHEAPITASPYGHDIVVNTGIIKQVLFQNDAPLLGVELTNSFAHPELDVEISRTLI
jgi:hypothetical protein